MKAPPVQGLRLDWVMYHYCSVFRFENNLSKMLSIIIAIRLKRMYVQCVKNIVMMRLTKLGIMCMLIIKITGNNNNIYINTTCTNTSNNEQDGKVFS